MYLADLRLRELTAGFVNVTDTTSSQTSGGSSKSSNRSTLRRCRTREHGMALLTISHAIEYLIDARLAQQEETTDSEREALAILLTANLSVYREGAEVVPLTDRLRQWFHGGGARNKSAGLTAY